MKSNYYLPFFVFLKENELMSSWFARMALQHETTVFSLSKFIFDSIRPYLGDIDKGLSEVHFVKLLKCVPISKIRFFEAQLNSYNLYLFNESNQIHNFRFITNVGKRLAKKRSYSMMFCAECLKEETYFRKNWRLSLSICCTKHNSMLNDTCDKCFAPLNYSKVNQFLAKPVQFELDSCHVCHNQLRFTKSEQATIELVTFQKYIDDLLLNGFNEEFNYSFLFFDGIEFLCQTLISKRKRNIDLIELIAKEYNFAGSTKVWIPSLNFNLQSLESRINIIRFLIKLLDDWPSNFVYFLSKARITYSYFRSEGKEIPYWIYKPLKFINSNQKC